MDPRPKCRSLNFKTFRKNIGVNLSTLELGIDFLDMCQQHEQEKPNRYIVLQNFASKHTVKKAKRQPTKWKKVFVNLIYDEGLLSRIYINSYNSIIKKIYNPTENGQKL